MSQPTGRKLADACADVLGREVCDELAEMAFDVALGYAFTLLFESGVDDPVVWPDPGRAAT